MYIWLLYFSAAVHIIFVVCIILVIFFIVYAYLKSLFHGRFHIYIVIIRFYLYNCICIW